MPSDMMLAGTAVMPVEFVMARAGLVMTVLIGPEGAAFFSARNLLLNFLVVILTALLGFQYLNIFISPSFYDLVSFRLRLVYKTGGREGLLLSEGGRLCRFSVLQPVCVPPVRLYSTAYV